MQKQLERANYILDHKRDPAALGPWSRHLFGMKSVSLIKDVLAVMDVALNKEAIAQHINCSLFKEYQFVPSELLDAGFDREILTAAGFVKDS